MSFQKAMFCVTNAAIEGTFPYELGCVDASQQAANQAHAGAWANRLATARTDCLAAVA